MTLVLFVIGLVVLGLLALRFGYDSRELVQSKELELARFGVNWTDPIKVRRAGLVRRARRRSARALLTLAERLAPGTAVATARSLRLNGTS